MTTENKYQRGKIYKLISNQTDLVYYGSTIEERLTNRLGGHRCSYRNWLNDKKNYMTSFEIIKYDDCKIILVENFPCNTKYELTAREQFYIDNNLCCNKNKAPTGLPLACAKKQYYEDNKDKIQCGIKYRFYVYINFIGDMIEITDVTESDEFENDIF